MVANKNELADGIVPFTIFDTKQAQQLGLEYLGSLIDQGDIKMLDIEQRGTG